MNINRTMILADFDVFDSNIETTATLSMIHLIKVTKEIYEDMLMLKNFVE
jgi:hypothetical protein